MADLEPLTFTPQAGAFALLLPGACQAASRGRLWKPAYRAGSVIPTLVRAATSTRETIQGNLGDRHKYHNYCLGGLRDNLQAERVLKMSRKVEREPWQLGDTVSFLYYNQRLIGEIVRVSSNPTYFHVEVDGERYEVDLFQDEMRVITRKSVDY